MKKYAIIAGIVLVVVLVAFWAGRKSGAVADSYSLYGYEGVLYRLGQVSGRVDVLVPSNEATLFMPVGQMQYPKFDSKMTSQQKASIAQNFKTLSQYIVAERLRGLGNKGGAVQKTSEQK